MYFSVNGARAPFPSCTWRMVNNWTCRLCGYSNPDEEDICCQQCAAPKK